MRVSWDNLIKDDPIKKKKDYSNPNDSRSSFKQDFDTICFSSSFRRLQNKVQVFPIEEGDFSRTRLTHSIEVMTIAQSCLFMH